jgi:hypothetical protein
MPEGHDRTKFVGLIGKNFEVDLTLIDLHVTAYSLEQHVDRFIRGVVRIGKIFGNGEHDLGIRHSRSSQQPSQPVKAIVDPESLCVCNR